MEAGNLHDIEGGGEKEVEDDIVSGLGRLWFHQFQWGKLKGEYVWRFSVGLVEFRTSWNMEFSWFQAARNLGLKLKRERKTGNRGLKSYNFGSKLSHGLCWSGSYHRKDHQWTH